MVDTRNLPAANLSSPPAQRGERIKVRGASTQRSLLLDRATPSLTLPRKGGGDDCFTASLL
jgi:hypothetical protein